MLFNIIFMSHSFSTVFAERTSEILLSTASVRFTPNEPIKLTSGKLSPVYIDCRRLISFPNERNELMHMAKQMIDSICYEYAFDSIAGGETAGIAFAAWLADLYRLPMQYIRKKPKGFGRNAQIEGELKAGQRVLLVEDLATDGGSKEVFIQAIRDAQAIVNTIFVLFYYDIFSESQNVFEKLNTKIIYLATWRDLLKVAKLKNSINETEHAAIKRFLDNPKQWSFS